MYIFKAIYMHIYKAIYMHNLYKFPDLLFLFIQGTVLDISSSEFNVDSRLRRG